MSSLNELLLLLLKTKISPCYPAPATGKPSLFCESSNIVWYFSYLLVIKNAQIKADL